MALDDFLKTLFQEIGIGGDKPVTNAGVVQSVKEKYPQYQDVEDAKLATALAERHPDQFGYLSDYKPDTPVPPKYTPKELRTDEFYKANPEIGTQDGLQVIDGIKTRYPQYRGVDAKPLAVALETKYPDRFKGLASKLGASLTPAKASVEPADITAVQPAPTPGQAPDFSKGPEITTAPLQQSDSAQQKLDATGKLEAPTQSALLDEEDGRQALEYMRKVPTAVENKLLEGVLKIPDQNMPSPIPGVPGSLSKDAMLAGLLEFRGFYKGLTGGDMEIKPETLAAVQARQISPELANAAGEINGGLALLAGVHAGLGTAGLSETIGARLWREPTLARYLAPMAVQGVDIGATGALREGINQVREGKLDLVKLGKITLESTAWGAGAGVISGVPNGVAQIAGASAYGFGTTYAKTQDPMQSTINGAVMGLFTAATVEDITAAQRNGAFRAARQNVAAAMEEAATEKGYSEPIVNDLRQKATDAFDQQVAKRGGFEKLNVVDYDKFSKEIYGKMQDMLNAAPEELKAPGSPAAPTPPTPELPAPGAPAAPSTEPTPETPPMAPAPVDESAMKNLVTKGGGDYVGIQEAPDEESQVIFNHPETKTTLSLPVSQITPENVAAKLTESAEKFKANAQPTKTDLPPPEEPPAAPPTVTPPEPPIKPTPPPSAAPAPTAAQDVLGEPNANPSEDVRALYHPNKDLPVAAAGYQVRARDFAIQNAAALMNEYFKKYGNVISTDRMRELFKPVGYTGLNSAIFQSAATALRNAYLRRQITSAEAQGKKDILYMAGGSGAGKSTALQKLGADVQQYGAVIDSNLASMDVSHELDYLIHKGFKPSIYYIYRDPREAWAGVWDRFIDGSDRRVVPLETHLLLHSKSMETIQKLMAKYGEDVSIHLIENTPEGLQPMTLEELRRKQYNEKELREKLANDTQELVQSGQITREAAVSALSPSRNRIDFGSAKAEAKARLLPNNTSRKPSSELAAPEPAPSAPQSDLEQTAHALRENDLAEYESKLEVYNQWKEIIGIGLRAPKIVEGGRDVMGEYNRLPLWMKNNNERIGHTLDEVEEAAREAGLLTPRQDLFSVLERLKKPTKPGPVESYKSQAERLLGPQEDTSFNFGSNQPMVVSEGQSDFYDLLVSPQKSNSSGIPSPQNAPFKIKYQEDGVLFFPGEKISSPADVAFAFQHLKNKPTEHFYTVGVRDGKVVSVELIAIGTINETPVDPKESIHLLEGKKADGYYLIHNHPSGNPYPSDADIHLFRRFSKSYDSLGFKFQGGIVINDTHFGFVDDKFTVSENVHRASVGDKTLQIPKLTKYLEWSGPKPTNPSITSPGNVFEIVKGVGLDWNRNAYVLYLNTRNVVVAGEVVSNHITEAKIASTAASMRAPSVIVASVKYTHFTPMRKNLKELGVDLLDVVGMQDNGDYRSAQVERDFSLGDEKVPYGSPETKTAPTFYSQLQKTISEKMPNRASVEQIKGIISQGVKQEEIDWSGLNEWLAQQNGPIEKSVVLDFLKSNEVKVEEVMKGKGEAPDFESLPKSLGNLVAQYGNGDIDIDPVMEEADRLHYDVKLDPAGDIESISKKGEGLGPTKFSQWQLPGGENYRELLLTLPTENTKDQLPPDAEVRLDPKIGKYYVFSKEGRFDGAISRRGADTPQEAKDLALKELNRGRSGGSAFTSSHFHEPNILAHVRFNDRTDADGNKVLFIEEVQSDWHQQGRAKGYRGDLTEEEKSKFNTLQKSYDEQAKEDDRLMNEEYQIRRASFSEKREPERKDMLKALANKRAIVMARMQVLSNQMAHFSSPGLIPDAPFKKTWHELAMKRMLRYAVENGYDKIAWTNGDQQADRYDLSKHVDKITWHSNLQAKPEMKNVIIHLPDGLRGFLVNPEGKITNDISGEFKGKDMSDVIGKDISQKILNSKDGELSGDGLKIGGAGMKGFYDKILPDFLNKYTKKWGGRVGETVLPGAAKVGNDDFPFSLIQPDGVEYNSYKTKEAAEAELKEHPGYSLKTDEAYMKKSPSVHSLEITPSMKDSVMGAGQALFDKGSGYGGKPPAKPPLATGGFHDPNEDPRNRKITPYEQNRLLTKGSTKREIGRMARSAREQAEKMLTPISSVLRSIHPSLRSALRKNAFLQGMATAADQKAVSPFIAKARELPHNDRSDLDLALKNSDMAVIKDIIQRNNMTTEYLAARRVLDDLHKRASDMGYDIGFLKNYWPRLILDKQGFLEAMKMDTKWADIESLIQQKEDELRRVLTDDERVALINTYLRGYAQGVIGLSETPNMKTREFDEVTPVMNRFYRDSMDAVLRYISETNHAIEARRFFGTKGREFYLDDLDVSIGEYVLRLLKADVVKTDDERRLKNVLTAYFKQESMNGFLAAYKDFTVITTLGNFVSALTQLQDLGFTVYRAPSKMFMALARALTGKSQITLPELGLEVVAEELKDARKTAMWAGKFLGLAGLSKLDRITAETHINAIISKYQDQAQKPNPEFIERMRDTFGERAPEVINQLKEKKLTDDIKFLAFCEILDVQPKALSEMPENYLRGGNARIFYALKTFQLRQIDAFRVEALHKMNQPGKKNKISGLRRLILMAMSLLLAGVGTDKLKDFVLGRKTSWSDLVTDNLLKLVGFSKWTIYKAKDEGIGSAALKTILPPMPFVDQLWKDIQTAGDKRGTQIVQSIPIVGKFYYWWMGQGALKRPVSDDAAWVRDAAKQYNLNSRKEYQALVMYSHRARLAPTAAERDDARQRALQLATRIRTSWEPNLKHLDQRRQKLDERHQKKVDLGYALK